MSQNKESFRFGLWLRKALCLFVLASSGNILVAQQHPDQPAPSPESQDVNPVVLQLPSYSQNIALLGTDQRFMDLAALQTRRRTFFIYGMGVSESYVDSFSRSTAGQSVSSALWSPHVAIINASNRSSFSVQYAPTIVLATSGSTGSQVYPSGSISFGQPVAHNWVLQLNSFETYGTDAVRLLSPLAFDVNNGIPIVDPSSAVFQFDRGKVFVTTNNVGLRWQRSPSQAVNFSVGESSLLSLDGGPNNNTIYGQVSYSAAVAPRTGINFGGNYYHGFTLGSCDSYGFTFGISHQVSRNVNVSVGGGPEFATSPCSRGLGGNYKIDISYPLSRQSRLGLSAGRSFATSYLANTRWSDTAVVSYARQLSEAVGIDLNSGYDRSVRTQSSLGTYVGYFVGVDLSWKLSRTIALSTTYRRFVQVAGGPDQGKNVAMISLGWNPLPIRIVK